jgi:DNA-binding IclR family transcriptional regulator
MATTAMSTVDKALSLLRHFSVQSPELGLSELARAAGYDKTTTLRCMTALARNGFVEQDAASRKYRLGLAPINLARIREHSFPVQAVLKRHLDRLAAETGETAHASLITGGALMTAMISAPERALRVSVDPSGALPLHATASGIVITAFMPADVRDAMLANAAFEAYTDATPADAAAMTRLLASARAEGIGRTRDTFEKDVAGTAAAFFGASGLPIGAIAVAAVSSRFSHALSRKIDAALLAAASAITAELGGARPRLENGVDGLAP